MPGKDACERFTKLIRKLETLTRDEFSYNCVATYDYIAQVDSDDVIVLSTRAIDDTDDDELAFVVCHEIAHILLRSRHQSELDSEIDKQDEVYKPLLKDMEGGFFAALFKGLLVGAVSGLSLIMTARGLSRENEAECDFLAIIFMEGAGYDSYGAETYIYKHGHEYAGFARELFSTHPYGVKRLESIQEIRQNLSDMYEEFKVYLENNFFS